MRLTASEIVGGAILPRCCVGFHEAHPRIAIELTLSNRQEDLLRREADIAVRMARPTQGALVVRRLGVTPAGFYAHRRLHRAARRARQHGRSDEPQPDRF